MKVGAAAATAAMVVAAVSSVCAAYGCAANGCAAYGRAVNEGDEGGGRGFPCSPRFSAPGKWVWEVLRDSH